jgi:adenine phosphoribosyltransferase
VHELRGRLTALFRWIDPGPAATHLISDVSGWWRDPAVLASIGPALGELFRPDRPTVVVSPEVTGLLLGPLVATSLDTGFVPAVKDDGDRRIAEATTWARTAPDYRGRTLRLGVRDRHVQPGDRVLVVDDWVATGAQIRTLYEIIAARRAVAVGTAAIVSDCGPDVARELGIRALLHGADLPT